MGINFPSSPAVGTLHPNPAQSGIPQYRWDGTAWVAAGDNKFALTVGDTPPLSPVQGQLWWDSDSGNLAVYYDDGSGLQWVQAVAVPMTDTAPADGKFYARQGSVWVEVPRYQRVPLVGGKSFDVQVPAGAIAVRLNGVIAPTSTVTIPLMVQVSFVPGVFRTALADYILYGFAQASDTAGISVNNGTSNIGGFFFANHANAIWPLTFEGTIQLNRPSSAAGIFSALFRAGSAGVAAIVHTFYASSVTTSAAGSATQVLALRFATLAGGGDNWGAGSYVNVEWM